ncbi:VirD4-like conjugal transfer protein, CD1115 family [[Clostridium] scindens]|uniref:VirD4-like conjugal transfer protein, CD1115 family n=1 Tax=Clostridium scindens (strain JCM 10418 / VPI 12708) TaxID=29347 RepID=UPI003AF03585
MKQVNVKKLLILNLPYLLFVWLFDKAAQAVRLSPGADFSAKLLNLGAGFSEALETMFPSLHPLDLLIGLMGAVCIRLVVYVKGKNAKKYRKGMEYGSARWGTAEDIKPYIDPVYENNILLTQTERLMMSNRPKDPKYARNKNILVIGGSGSGKTRFFVKVNLMQCTSKDYPASFLVTDPKGTLVLETGSLLVRAGYRIKVLNTINFQKSMHYNPFVYIRSEKDILKLTNTIIANTKGDGEKSTEDFWVKAERLLYCALIGYIWYEAPEEEKNFITLLEMINASEAREDDEEYQSPVDLMFSRLEEKEPDHFAVKQYKKYKLAAGKTAKSILISCGARLAPFDIKELRDLMEYDDLELDTLGDRKTALFLIMSDTDTTFNFVIAMLQSQLFNLLCDKADDEYGGRLPVHVRCILDEFANIGQIPNFDKLIATIRSREISASIILQSQSQLKTIYKDAADTIVGNCDTTLFLGGKEKSTLKELSEILGKETIDSFNTSENRGTQISHGLNYQKLGKELMTQDEIAVMDGGKCILQIRGTRPFLSDKFDITRHKNYKYLADADKKNEFDIERYMRRRPPIVKPDEPFEMYELTIEPENENE